MHRSAEVTAERVYTDIGWQNPLFNSPIGRVLLIIWDNMMINLISFNKLYAIVQVLLNWINNVETHYVTHHWLFNIIPVRRLLLEYIDINYRCAEFHSSFITLQWYIRILASLTICYLSILWSGKHISEYLFW